MRMARSRQPPFTQSGVRAGMLVACGLWAVACKAEDPGVPALTPAEQVQNATAVKLTEAAAAQAEKQKPSVEREIDDIQRTLRLPADRLALLRMAGEGALQSTRDQAARSAVMEAERRVKGVVPKLVAKVLAGMENSGGSRVRLSQNRFWDDAVQQLLTEDERHKWEAMVADRAAYRAHAIAELAVIKITATLQLSDEQGVKLLPLIEKAAREYLPDMFSSFTSDGEEGGMYLPYAQMFILGVPEEDVRAVIKPEQWTSWHTAAGENSSNWEWIKRQHDQRTRKGGVEK